MELCQRLEINLSDEYADDLIKAIKANPGCCDTVWLPSQYGYAPLCVHEKVAAATAATAKKFRDNGIKVCVQLSNTIGHGQSMSYLNCEGLVYEGSKAYPLVGENGESSPYCFCPRGEEFSEYITEVIKIYAREVKPDTVWVDDDFRIPNHSPVKFGCFCERCIDKFNKENGFNYTRASLVKEITHGDKTVREKWMLFTRAGYEALMKRIVSGIHEQSPDTCMGLEHALPGGFIMCNHNYAFDPMKEISGKAPKSRPGGGAYDDTDPNEIIKKGMEISMQNAALPDYVEYICPEIENIPHVAFGKSAPGSAFETSFYFACGATDMSYAQIRQTKEPVKIYENALRLYSKQRNYWEMLSRNNKKSRPAGLHYFKSKNAWNRDLQKGEGIAQLHGGAHTDAEYLMKTGVPVCFSDAGENDTVLLYASEAVGMTDDDIKKLMNMNVITDGLSIKFIQSRGFDIPLTVGEIPSDRMTSFEELYTDCEINEGLAKVWATSRYTPGGNDKFYFMPTDEKRIKSIADYKVTVPLPALTEDEKRPYGIAEAIVDMGKGKKWAVLGMDAWKGVIGSERRERFFGLCNYISGKPVCVHLITPLRAVLMPRENSEGKISCVSIVNCTIGVSGETELEIYNPAGEKFTFISQTKQKTELEYEKRGNIYHIRIPSIDGWSQGSVFCE